MYQRVGKAAYKADLQTTIDLDNYFGNPHKKFKSLHIAGTNGKGSSSHMLASVLQSAGYKVGLYTSPHLRDFRERIKINGTEIAECEVIDFVEQHKKEIFRKIKPSFFEMTVALAFNYFAREKVDIAVVEVGMGGRLDSTNIIRPLVSLITNISLDHTAFLGTDLKAIAREKAGIIKKGIPLVVSEFQEETACVFKKKAKENETEIHFADKLYASDYSMMTTDAKQIITVEKNGKTAYSELKIDLLGLYQRKNALGVLSVLDLLKKQGFAISTPDIYQGFENITTQTGLKGRWQILGNNPLVVCDTAHNQDGIRNIVQQIEKNAFRKLHCVLGFVKDKMIDEILALFPKTAEYYFTKAKIPRAMDENTLHEKALQSGLSGKCFSSVAEAVEAAKQNAKKEDMIFIGGSTFVVAEI